MGRWKKRSNRKGGFQSFAKRQRAPMAWWRPGGIPLTDMTGAGPTVQAETVVMSGADLIPQPAAVLDRARWIKILRVICRIVLVVTGGGNACTQRYWVGWRIVDLNGGAIGAPADVRLATAADRREDWIYRASTAYSIGAADAAIVKPVGDGGNSELFLDFKPGRKLQFGQALVMSYGVTTLGGVFGGGGIVSSNLSPEILVSGVV